MSFSSLDAATDDEVGAGERSAPATKRIKSSPPDVIVSVGSGENAQQFRCYKVILSFASGYFDAMLSSSMKEEVQGKIELPDKNPEEWKLFYTFISPETEVRDNAKIDPDNAMKLVPWFHEFQMNYLLKKCDKCLAAVYSPNDFEASIDFWKKEEGGTEDDENKRKREFAELFAVAKIASVYGLESTKPVVTECIAQLMSSLVDTGDLFDLPTIKTLLEMVSPIQLDGDELKMSDEGCTEIWPALERIISPHITNLSQDIICDMSTFSLIVYSFMQIKIEKDKVAIEQRKVHSAKKIINKTLEDYPIELYQDMPTMAGVDTESRNTLKRIISRHYESEKKHFRRLGLDLPTFYSS